MQSAPLPENEEQRIEALRRYRLLDTSAEKAYDEIAKLASYICQTPIALMSIVDRERQWFKAKVGLEADETSRDVAFCAHAILGKEVFTVEDASKDERFHDNPLVASAPNIRFYAGAPLITPDGYPLGTICAIDQRPRQLSQEQIDALQSLANQAASLLELRRTSRILRRQNDNKLQLLSILSHDLGNAFNGILFFANELKEQITDDSLKELASQLSSISNATHDQLKGLLEWAKNEIANVEYNPKTVKLDTALMAVLEEMIQRADNKKIKLSISNIDSEIYADTNMLASAVRNLLSNAIKFSPIGSQISLDITHSKDYTAITVTDSGPGIPEDKLSVFEGNTNFKSTVGTDGEQGSGLGLNLVYRIIERHNGYIKGENLSGGGAKVSLYFPNRT